MVHLLVAILAGEDEEEVPEEEKMTFYARAALNLEVRVLPHGRANMQLTDSHSRAN